MATCPAGHKSASEDYCESCGLLIGAAPSLTPHGAAPVPGEPCPNCGTPRSGKYCELCGYDFAAGPEVPGPAVSRPASPPAPSGGQWTAVVTADRARYDAVQAAGGPDAAGIAFPDCFPQRRFPLTGTEVRIGRHSASHGISPEIDLSAPSADPGVSRLHAVLRKSPDGTWSVIDLESTNGTAVNSREIPPGRAVPLRDGDRIHLGAWTELRMVRVNTA